MSENKEDLAVDDDDVGFVERGSFVQIWFVVPKFGHCLFVRVEKRVAFFLVFD